MSGASNYPNFEVVVGTNSGAARRFFRDNTNVTPTGGYENAPWSNATDGFPASSQNHVSMILSTYGNLECVVVLPGGFVEHWWRDTSGWHFSTSIGNEGGSTKGPPSLIQAAPTGSSPGDFELLIPFENGVIGHYTRHNDQPNLPWKFNPSEQFGNDARFVALIQSDYGPPPPPGGFAGGPGNLECVVVQGPDDELVHYWRNNNNGSWTNGGTITNLSGTGLADGHLPRSGATGAPGMVAGGQVGLNSHANFEVVVPVTGQTLAHFYRDNQNGEQWFGTEAFGNGLYVALLKSNVYESLEVVAGGSPAGLAHYRRNVSGGDWTFTRTFAPDNAGGAVGFAQDLYQPIIE